MGDETSEASEAARVTNKITILQHEERSDVSRGDHNRGPLEDVVDNVTHTSGSRLSGTEA